MPARPTPQPEARPEATGGTVLQIQGFSVNDGEGIRSVIFLPGCPLRCQWCANPETWTPAPKLAVFQGKCASCGACATACPLGLDPRGGGRAKHRCAACGRCTEACPTGALNILIREMRVDEVVRTVERDAIFFRESGGGVTFSGGEPTFQAPFLRSLVRELDRRGIDLCLETCGWFVWDEVADIFAKVGHVFYDCKHMDSETHQRLTGVPNERILANCARIAASGTRVTIRVPLIHGLNDCPENLRATAEFITKSVPGGGIELLPYHDLGREKYRALGLAAPAEFLTPGADEVEQAETFFRDQGIPVVRYR